LEGYQMNEINRGPTDYMAETILAYIRENGDQREKIETLHAQIRQLQDTMRFASAEAKRMEQALDKIAQYGEDNRSYSNCIIDGVPLADFAARASGIER
jgi:hypothetical protein